MKSIIFTSFLITLTFWGCSDDQSKLTEQQEQKIIQIGESSSNALMKELKTHLIEALNESDPVTAFEFCAVQAMPITDDVQQNLPEGVEIKRTSFKYRNPANAPDQYEKKALEYFETTLAEHDSLPKHYIQTEESNQVLSYYKPMRMTKLCLKCHGAKQQVDDGILKSLQENYPEDNALGYEEGDFRGVIRVSVAMNNIN